MDLHVLCTCRSWLIEASQTKVKFCNLSTVYYNCCIALISSTLWYWISNFKAVHSIKAIQALRTCDVFKTWMEPWWFTYLPRDVTSSDACFPLDVTLIHIHETTYISSIAVDVSGFLYCSEYTSYDACLTTENIKISVLWTAMLNSGFK